MQLSQLTILYNLTNTTFYSSYLHVTLPHRQLILTRSSPTTTAGASPRLQPQTSGGTSDQEAAEDELFRAARQHRLRKRLRPALLSRRSQLHAEAGPDSQDLLSGTLKEAPHLQPVTASGANQLRLRGRRRSNRSCVAGVGNREAFGFTRLRLGQREVPTGFRPAKANSRHRQRQRYFQAGLRRLQTGRVLQPNLRHRALRLPAKIRLFGREGHPGLVPQVS